MLTDSRTDFVYFSEWSRRDFPTAMRNICRLLDRHGVGHGFLDNTRDYWCRDYMPVQVSRDKFVQYVYRPDYLDNPKDRKYITDPTAALAGLGIRTVKTDLVIDGGNVIKCPNKVIMTEKVFYENRHKERRQIADELQKLFEAEPVFIPWDRSERFGHADGVVRWTGDGKVMLTEYGQSRYFSRLFRSRLEKHFEVVQLTFTTRPRRRDLTWAYVNFIQTGNVIIVPAFNIKEDSQALRQIADAFPDYSGKIEQADVSEIISHGGALNCISWNIKTP